MVLFKVAKIFFKPSSALRLAPYLLIVPIIVFQALSLTGCISTSPAIPNIYIVSLRPNHNTTDVPTQVRIGYFGICGIDEDGTRCESASGRSVETLTKTLFPGLPLNNKTTTSDRSRSPPSTTQAEDIVDLVTTAIDLQSRSFVSVLAGAAVLFVPGVAATLLHGRDARSPSPAGWDRPRRRSALVRRAAYGLLGASAALAFAAALATTQAAGALEYASSAMRHCSVRVRAGTTLQVLQWLAFGFTALFALAVPFLARPSKAAEAQAYKEEA